MTSAPTSHRQSRRPATPVLTRRRSQPLMLDSVQARLLHQLRARGPASRSALASRLGLTNTAKTRLSRELLHLGLVEEVSSVETFGRGRPSVPIQLSPRGGYSVGATVHVGIIDVALIDYTGSVIGTWQAPFDDPDPVQFARQVRTSIHNLAETHNLIGWRLFGVGISVPGASYSASGDRWNTPESVAGWRGVPLREILDEALGLPIQVENDAISAGLAEYYLGGLIERYSTAILILLGHGIGAGVVADGRLLRGEKGNAGDIGGLYPKDQPRPSTLDLLATLRNAGCPASSVADVARFADQYAKTLTQWTKRAAIQLQPLINAGYLWFNPGAITLSSALPVSIMERLAERLSEVPMPTGLHRTSPPEIRVSKLGMTAPTLGAALLPIHALELA